MAEATLQKLKVTELKDLLSKHGLVQSGKKEDLVKRLLDAGVTGEVNGTNDALVDVPDVPAAVPAPTDAPAPTAAAPVQPEAPAAAAPPANEATEQPAEPEAEIELTEEQKKQKARAERFGMPWVPKKPSPVATPAAKPAAATPAAVTSQPPKEKKEKPAALDKSAALGISDEVLARRAARFGPVEKKAAPAAAAPATATPAAAAVPPTEKKELSPEAAAKLAADEEKKRKRAEKFGTIKPAAEPEAGDAAPDAKKIKV